MQKNTIKLFTLQNNKDKVKSYNDLCEELKSSEPSIDWEEVKISSIYDEFYPYDIWLKRLAQEKDIKIIKDTIPNIKNVYITKLNWEYNLELLTGYKVNKFKCIYGVCDNASQAIEYCNKNVLSNKDKNYILIMTPILKRNEGEYGWRWHKWGSYIGVQNPQHEYISEEENIDMVYVFELKELIK